MLSSGINRAFCRNFNRFRNSSPVCVRRTGRYVGLTSEGGAWATGLGGFLSSHKFKRLRIFYECDHAHFPLAFGAG